MTRRIFRLLLIVALVGGLLLTFLGFWALRSEGGRDFLMARIAAQLPEDSSLTWSKLEGSMWNGLAITDLRYADGKYVFTAQTVNIKNALWPLLSKRLDI